MLAKRLSRPGRKRLRLRSRLTKIGLKPVLAFNDLTISCVAIDVPLETRLLSDCVISLFHVGQAKSDFHNQHQVVHDAYESEAAEEWQQNEVRLNTIRLNSRQVFVDLAQERALANCARVGHDI